MLIHDRRLLLFSGIAATLVISTALIQVPALLSRTPEPAAAPSVVESPPPAIAPPAPAPRSEFASLSLSESLSRTSPPPQVVNPEANQRVFEEAFTQGQSFASDAIPDAMSRSCGDLAQRKPGSEFELIAGATERGKRADGLRSVVLGKARWKIDCAASGQTLRVTMTGQVSAGAFQATEIALAYEILGSDYRLMELAVGQTTRAANALRFNTPRFRRDNEVEGLPVAAFREDQPEARRTVFRLKSEDMQPMDQQSPIIDSHWINVPVLDNKNDLVLTAELPNIRRMFAPAQPVARVRSR